MSGKPRSLNPATRAERKTAGHAGSKSPECTEIFYRNVKKKTRQLLPSLVLTKMYRRFKGSSPVVRDKPKHTDLQPLWFKNHCRTIELKMLPSKIQYIWIIHLLGSAQVKHFKKNIMLRQANPTSMT